MIGRFFTDTGQVRSHNEDAGGAYKNDKGQILAVVADGMGGHRAGDVASQLAVTILHNRWKETLSVESPDQAETWLKEAIHEVNQKILEHSHENEECRGMGTTVVVSICSESFVSVGHIGDSRVYLADSDGFRQITEDHSLVNELVRSGQISEDEAEHHPRKNVLLKALGTDEQVTADILTVEFEEDNRLLLCSDGLTNKVSGDELAEIADYEGDWENFGHNLIDLANDRGGEDNITLVIVHNTQAPEKEGVEEC
ncbi:Stp1/IreP family PP2C-type Ser/Thr phosphatase [Halobacillus sp. Marseille-Q1614]|uniref:Stp1/IreP family PP2C-type Ser/Thr phosphatase n=1 Tax=Halobacillus sp. Marseille-Q1614 TaxID=2709134 RepID=UPI00156F4D2D|nr:Stp1/IreP family PP2C-type Ser/Thr phosphatase [Halobacillus sp. Marseille-Q1614]